MSKCQECGITYRPRTGRGRPNTIFCTPACGKTFNNRRMRRGAELYDLFRAMRRDRAKAKDLGVWNAMCVLDMVWQEEDDAAGRKAKSFFPPAYALNQLFEMRDRMPSKNRYVGPAPDQG